MQLLLLLSLAGMASAFYDNPTGCIYKDSCAITPHWKQITCHADKPCTCKTGSGIAGDCNTDVTGITNADMDKKKCKDKCDELGATCLFYRWDQAPWTKDITCTLMDTNQCSSKGDPCLPHTCESGTKEGECKDDDSDRPEGGPCTVHLPSKPDVTRIEWTCTDPYDMENTMVPVYTDKDETLKNGAFCETVTRCTKFAAPPSTVAQYLRYTCNDGTLDPDTNPAPIPNPIDGKVLKYEPTCYPDDLMGVPKYKPDDGTDLICSNVDNFHGQVVKAPNVCALICDRHHVVTIKNGWKGDDSTTGEPVWNLYVVGGGAPTDIEEGTVLKCWDK